MSLNFIINKFSIISTESNKAFEQKFDSKINLIVGEKDSGKSTLARAMLYSLGCDVKSFDFIDEMPNNIYIMDFNINDDNFIIIRKRLKKGRGANFFKVIKNSQEVRLFYSTGDYVDYLNAILHINVVATHRNNTETKLYPNHIFLPFYVDQDFSWQNYLNATFKHVNFIKNYKKIVLEYFTGAKSNEYYRLLLDKNKLKNEKIDLEALIKSKELIIEENNKNIKIIENVNIKEFQKQYKYILKIYNNIIETEHKLKKELNHKIYKKNSLLDLKSNLDSSIDDLINDELDESCPYCEQKIYKSMENNYKLFSVEENLIREREKIEMHLYDIQEEISEAKSNINNMKSKNIKLQEKLNSDSRVIDLAERVNSYALNQINNKLIEEIIELQEKLISTKKELKNVKKELNKLNEKNIARKYEQLMINAFKELKVPFEYKNYYNSNLESVKIKLSGATKVQAFIAQYISIYDMIVDCENTVNIPLILDTFLKDDFNESEVNRTANFIFNHLKEKSQSFIFVSNNEQTMKSVSSYNYKEIKLDARNQLLKSNYSNAYKKYSELMKK